jgi:glycosidase
MDGILDFIASETLRKTYGYQTMNAVSLERFMTRQTGFFDPNLLLPTFLDNHDMDRFLFIAGNDKEALMRAAAAQMQLPGPPIIYYGTEVGLSQRLSKADGDGDKQARLPMLWGKDQDTRLLEYYKGLIRQRRSDHTRTVAV